MTSTMKPRRRARTTILRTALGLAAVAVFFAGLVAPASAAFSVEAFGGAFSNPDGSDNFQAGGHPDLTTKVIFSKSASDPNVVDANTKNVRVDLPAGVVGNAVAMPKCTSTQIAGSGLFGQASCPVESQIGTADLELFLGGPLPIEDYPVYNIEPPRGVAAQFAFNLFGVLVALNSRVVSEPEYHLVTEVVEASQSEAIPGTTFHFWGVPADSAHDAHRTNPETGAPPMASTAPRLPMMTAPTACLGPLSTRMEAVSWQEPSSPVSGVFDTDLDGDSIAFEGCNQLEFDPKIEARPTTNIADSPSGLDVKLTVPQNEDPDGLAEAMLKDSVVNFPAGMTLNSAAGQGLEACSPAQIGLTSPLGQQAKFDDAPASCPEAAKIGSAEVNTPLLEKPLKGSVFQAQQGNNPFKSLLGIYVVAESPDSGVRIKLAGHPMPDPNTGQLRVAFDNNPQLPFQDFKLNFFTGPRAVLKTPLACGNFTTTSQMVPWTSPEGATATPSDTFAITKAPSGDCLKNESEAPNKPSFSAGSADPAAGAYAPFTLRIARADGTAPIKQIDATLPKGLLGKLVGIPYCSDAALAAASGKSGKAEQSSPSCPSASQIGSVNVASGAGSNPLNIPGKAYLAGPYKGAPLSMAIVTPAVAGPFDLGTVVVRTALNVNPETAQIHAVSDELPTILQGIPLDIRQITVNMDKPQFTLNPTSCDPTTVDGSALSVFGQSTSLSNRFQVGGCAALGFKPKLSIRLKGATKRGQNPALRAVLTNRPGDANIAKAVVSLPHSEFLAQNHIKTICTRVQFAAGACPPGSIYGKVSAWSPLLDQPLSGPVYLRSSSNKLPDLVADLNGQIRVNVVGRIDSVKGGIRTSFETVPDAPVSKFVIEMAGGKKSLLENSRNLCATTNKATVQMDGQNGKTADSAPVVKAAGCKKAKKKRGGGKKAKAGKGSRR